MNLPQLQELLGKSLYIDFHAHPDHYNNGATEMLKETERLSLLTFANATDHHSYERLLALADECPLIVPCFGIHPMKAGVTEVRWDEAEEGIKNSPVVGEIGLDHTWVEDRSTYPRQREVFLRLVQLADKWKKPICLHTKGAEEEILNILSKEYTGIPVVHWYSGPKELIPAYLELGSYFTLSVELESNPAHRAVLEKVPIDRLLIETDNPAGIEWLHQRPGMPADILKVYQTAAGYFGMEEQAFAGQVHDNCARIFSNQVTH